MSGRPTLVCCRAAAVSMSGSRAVAITFAVFVLQAQACSADGAPVELPEPDGDAFARDVYPLLLRDCGTSTCHGARERFFRVVGPGRMRLSAQQAPLDPATAQEVLESYRRARAMLQPDGADRPLLLRKPLALAAGGATHGGRDAYGRNVYASRSDPSYRAIERWARGASGASP